MPQFKKGMSIDNMKSTMSRNFNYAKYGSVIITGATTPGCAPFLPMDITLDQTFNPRDILG